GKGNTTPPSGGCAPRLGKKTRTLYASGSSPESKRPAVNSDYRPLLGNASQALKQMRRARLSVTLRSPYGERQSTLQIAIALKSALGGIPCANFATWAGHDCLRQSLKLWNFMS